MPKLNFDVDEATLLKAYKISSLRPTCVPPIRVLRGVTMFFAP